MDNTEVIHEIYQKFEDAVAWTECNVRTCSKRCSYSSTDLHKTDLLYHYTTLGALFSIASSGIMRLSNSMVLNDKMESKHTEGLCDEIFTDYPELRLELKSNYFSKLFDMDNVFILSLTTNRDSMPMWYYYALGDGCNFSLSVERLCKLDSNWKNRSLLSKYVSSNNDEIVKSIINLVNDTSNKDDLKIMLKEALSDDKSLIALSLYFAEQNFRLTDKPAWGYSNTQPWFFDISPVIYCRNRKRNILEQLIRCYLSAKNNPAYTGYSSAIRSAFIRKMKRCAIFFKDDMFYPEEEVRLAVIIHPDLLKHVVCYYENHGAFIPYIQLDMKDNQTLSSFMKGIILGPGNKLDIAASSIERYLRDNGTKNPKVEQSEAPLRYYKKN